MSNRPDFSQYAAIINAIQSCAQGVKRADGAIVASLGVDHMAFVALESVLRALDTDCSVYVADFPQVEKIDTRTTYPTLFNHKANIA